jgi:hypothetical protein
MNSDQSPAASTEQTPATDAEQAPVMSSDQTPAATTEQTPATGDTVGQSNGDGSTNENASGGHDWENEVAEGAKMRATGDESEYGQQPAYDSGEEKATEGQSASRSDSDGQPGQSAAPAVAEETRPSGDYESAGSDSRYGDAVSPSVTERGDADSESSINQRYEGEPGETPSDSSAPKSDGEPSQEDTTSSGSPVVDTVAKAAVQTLSDFGTAVWSLSCQIAATDWQSSF